MTEFAASAWPVAPDTNIAYAEISDYLGLMFHKGVATASCPSCHTVNRGCVTRCRACGEAMPTGVDEQIDTSSSRHAARKGELLNSNYRPLRNVLFLVLTPAVLLSSMFVGWEMSRSASRTVPEVAQTARVARAQTVAPNLSPPPSTLQAPRKLQEIALVTPERDRSEADAAPRPQESTVEAEDDDAGALSPRSSSSVPRKASNASRSRAVRATSDPLAACRDQVFFARAICINTRCAEPGASRFGQCRQALRQRKIDEARRNPTLVG